MGIAMFQKNFVYKVNFAWAITYRSLIYKRGWEVVVEVNWGNITFICQNDIKKCFMQ